MDLKTRRKHLNEHEKACRDIEMAELAIHILEGITGCQSVIATLKRKQKTYLRRIDAAAEKLGAPYGA